MKKNLILSILFLFILQGANVFAMQNYSDGASSSQASASVVSANSNLTANSIKFIATQTLRNACLKNIYQNIFNYPPERLVELSNLMSKDIFYSNLEFKLSKELMNANRSFFFPDIEQYPRIAQIFWHNSSVTSAVFSPDGQQILTASSDHTAKLWNLDGSLAQIFRHNNSVYTAVFSPNGQQILTTAWGAAAILWNLDGTLAQTFRHNGSVYTAVFSPDGQQILTAASDADATAKLWNLDGTLAQTFQHNGWISSAVFSPDGQQILTTSSGYTAKLWNLDGTLAQTFQHNNSVYTAVFSPDGQQILTTAWDATAKLWNLDGSLAQIFQHNDLVNSAVFSPDGQQILTTSRDNTTKLWNLDGSLIQTFQHNDLVFSAVFSPNGQQILTTSDDHTAKLWKGHPLWNLFSLPEFALILLILRYKDFVKSNPKVLTLVMENLNQIDGAVQEEQKYIRNYLVNFLYKPDTSS